MDANPQTITWVVLAGGKGQRMSGQDKGLITVAGISLIDIIVKKLQHQIMSANRNDSLLISANRNIPSYEKYANVVTDLDPEFKGPLSGMLAAMINTDSDWIAVVPCDSPNIPRQFVDKMITATEEDANALVAYDGKHLQPVFCLIKRSLLPELQRFLQSDERKVGLFFHQVGAKKIDFSDNPELFVNINHPEDLASYITSMASGAN